MRFLLCELSLQVRGDDREPCQDRPLSPWRREPGN
jgi:hypothetical protein